MYKEIYPHFFKGGLIKMNNIETVLYIPRFNMFYKDQALTVTISMAFRCFINFADPVFFLTMDDPYLNLTCK